MAKEFMRRGVLEQATGPLVAANGGRLSCRCSRAATSAMKDTVAHSTILCLLDRSVASDWSFPIRRRWTRSPVAYDRCWLC
jgi:hypothetical protein